MDDGELERLFWEQVSYYRTRAPEYDATSLEGQALDSGEDQQWLTEQNEALRALARFAPTGRVLELAAGTGQWIRHLVSWADSVIAVDASPEALAINRSRVSDHSVSHRCRVVHEMSPVPGCGSVLLQWIPMIRLSGSALR